MTRTILTAIVLACTLGAQAGAETQARPYRDLTPEERQAARAIGQACRADMKRLCDGVEPGQGRILACFREHPGEVSPGCQDALRQNLPTFRAAHAGGQG